MQQPRPKYVSSLTAQCLHEQVESRLLRGTFVKQGALRVIGVALFEFGAILGHAFRNHLPDFVLAFGADPDHVESSLAYMHEEGARVAKCAEEASGIHDLLAISAMRRWSTSAPVTEWTRWFKVGHDQRIPSDDAHTIGEMYCSVGSGFGADYPDRLEALYEATYHPIQPIDPTLWQRFYEAGGLARTSRPPEYPPFEERQREDVESFKAFASQYYSELTGLQLVSVPGPPSDLPKGGPYYLDSKDPVLAAIQRKMRKRFLEVLDAMVLEMGADDDGAWLLNLIVDSTTSNDKIAEAGAFFVQLLLDAGFETLYGYPIVVEDETGVRKIAEGTYLAADRTIRWQFRARDVGA